MPGDAVSSLTSAVSLLFGLHDHLLRDPVDIHDLRFSLLGNVDFCDSHCTCTVALLIAIFLLL